MTYEEWKAELKTYRSPKRAVDEVLEGVQDHLEGAGACRENMTVIDYVRNQYTGVGPQRNAAVCSRGTRGCNLEHNDTQALGFTLMGLRRIAELQKKAA